MSALPSKAKEAAEKDVAPTDREVKQLESAGSFCSTRMTRNIHPRPEACQDGKDVAMMPQSMEDSCKDYGDA